jgi:putative BNR repeat neuraminidase
MRGTRHMTRFHFFMLVLLILPAALWAEETSFRIDDSVTLNVKADGYRGIWYFNQRSNDEYVYKYSGGLGTYCAKHKPLALYSPEVNKTFFCYGGTTEDSNRHLLHMVSYYDHSTGEVPRPTLLLDKQTKDAHDNPVISLDEGGHIWIFSTSHGTDRPSYIHRSRKPYDINSFELIKPTRETASGPKLMDNFSYMQPWYVPGKGFIAFFTRYKDPVQRTICCMTSPDGRAWSQWKRLSEIDEGAYQISTFSGNKAAAAFNIHPLGKGVNWRTNLYYLETNDFGRTWRSAEGKELELPLMDADNPALVYDYAADSLLVYLKDIRFDLDGNPVILIITSKGYESGPENGPRIWRTARWTGREWEIREAMRSDNNYDMGSLYIEDDGLWRIIAPTQTGPQPYNPGGEVAMWLSRDKGASWKMAVQLTNNSPRNHTYVRRPVNAAPGFYAIWADGHGRQPSKSCLYIADSEGNVMQLPEKMKLDMEKLR